MLKILNLTKKYSTLDGEIAALDGVSLTAADGEFIAIVGKSGSGKSTLLNMIGGLDIPDSGSILLDGTDIVKLSNRQTAKLRRQKIGIIYQFYNLIPELNVSENITLPTELDGGEIDREWLASILKTVGLDGRENAYPNTLSGGQQQRVAIARALYNKPSLILADEVLTPDSSRFWPQDLYAVGSNPPSLDKQFVRDWLDSINFNHQPPGPVLPDDVISRTREIYVKAYEELSGLKLV